MPGPSKVLVTGATGFIGRALVPTLATRGVSIRAAVRRDADQVPSAAEVVAIGDLATEAPSERLFDGVEAVVHLAARAHRTDEGPDASAERFRLINSVATLRMATAAARAGVKRFVFLSSVGVLGERTTSAPFHAGDIPAPRSEYGRSKLAAEEGLAAIGRETGLEVVVVRPPLVYGPGAPGNLRRLMRLVRAGWPLPFGSIHNRRTLLNVDNLVDLIHIVLTHPGAVGTPLLAGDADVVSTPDLMRWIGEGLGRPARLLAMPSSVLVSLGALAGRARELRKLTDSLDVDIGATVDRTGWRPRIATPDGIRAMARADRVGR